MAQMATERGTGIFYALSEHERPYELLARHASQPILSCSRKRIDIDTKHKYDGEGRLTDDCEPL